MAKLNIKLVKSLNGRIAKPTATAEALGLPKRGFNNIFAKPLEIVNVSALNKFEDGATVNVCDLLEKGILSKCEYGVKILGNGSLEKKLIVRANAFSASAKEKIVAAGGKYEVV